MKSNLMTSSSMTPLSVTTAPKSPEEIVQATVLAQQGPTIVAKPKPVAADDDEDDKDKKKKDDDKDSKSKKAADDDEDDDKKDKKKKDDDAKAILAAERARMVAIIDSPAGKASFAANPEKTLRFVLMHSGSPDEAIATLELFGGNLQASAKSPPLRERMENVKVEIGSDAVGGPSDDKSAMAAAIVMAGKRRRGEID